MHLILKNQVIELAEEYELTSKKESKLFEFFCNFSIVSKHYLGRFNPADITTKEDDASLDGIAIVVDGELITTSDDATEIFKTHKTNLVAEVIITQVKSGEQFTKDEISNFKLGLDDFLSLEPKLPNGRLNKESIEILKIIFENSRKIRNRRPNISIYYCTSGAYKSEREIQACFNLIEESVKSTDFFYNVLVEPLGRGEILKLYASLTQKNEAKLKVLDYLGMTEMPGIPQSYIAVSIASHFIDSLLLDEEGNLKQSVFEENVRSFLGDENDVNLAIQGTLRSSEKKSLFSVLNNGITIVAPELNLTPNTKEFHLTNYQIINGCQTSNTLFENRKLLTDEVKVVIKFIESPDNDVSNDIISATNSQSEIAKEAFFGLRNKAKLVQKYFDAKNQSSAPENHIYFERRQAEYRGRGYQATRIFDVREVTRCYAAMFLNIPHNSARYVKTLFSASGENIFKEHDHESYYYAACLALYKYQTLINGRKIGAPNYTRLRWHVIQAFKWLCHNKIEMPPPNSKKADKYAQKIIDILHSDDKSYIAIFEESQSLLDLAGMPTDDELKRGKFTNTLLDAATKKFA
ncbi:AIPR family protein [Nodosilinea sp. LEGE 07088]|uniref:AIPR family protein n=1 Tax=Nodosilinea sp. LEGE 07088 TaxID=2777968 RepID=UPI00187E8F00|nr:AIPR family protein [Nodosilinea sp. LEGE 07088]MBE9140535.1 AIPR family protein [Nodosilinea sp. LEGE 07088]